jgi:hypothetical protein
MRITDIEGARVVVAIRTERSGWRHLLSGASADHAL